MEKCKYCLKKFVKKHHKQVYCCSVCRKNYKKVTYSKEIFRLSEEEKKIRERILKRKCKGMFDKHI